MTGSLQVKTMRSGKRMLYVYLSYKDPTSGKWKSKQIPTGLEEKGNRKKAAALIPSFVERYSYLEQVQETVAEPLDPEIILCDYLNIWLKHKRSEIDETTFEGYEYRTHRIKAYFEPLNLKLKDVTSRQIDQYLRYELNYGKINQKTKEKEPLSVRTVRSRKAILFAAFNQACIDGLIKSNPALPVKVSGKKNSDYEEELLFLTEEELTEFLTFLSENYPRLMPIAFIAGYYGLRRSELLGLKWSAIDFEKRLVTIHYTVVRNKQIHEKDKTKTKNSMRDLYLFDNAVKCLSTLKKEQDENRMFFGSTYRNEKDFVFTHEDGSPYNPNWLSKQFSKAADEFGRPEITLHNLRHSCASIAINRGWNIKTLQYWLGHSDIQTTMNIYAHYSKKNLNSTNDDMNFASENSAKLFA